MRPSASRCTRSKVSMIGPISTSSPVSSRTSRRAASPSDSPRSSSPPGSDHSPLRGSWARRTISARSPRTTTAPTPTTGCAGYSLAMKSHTEYLTFNLKGRLGFENITPKVDAAVRKSGVKEGLVLVNAMHITASVFINDDEHGLHQDYTKWLEKLAPFDASPERYAHNRTGEDNADAHMKRQIMGREVVVAITNGKLDFGPWEQIFYGEFDGKRRKRVLLKIIGE